MKPGGRGGWKRVLVREDAGIGWSGPASSAGSQRAREDEGGWRALSSGVGGIQVEVSTPDASLPLLCGFTVGTACMFPD